jgi:hypothetical protein
MEIKHTTVKHVKTETAKVVNDWAVGVAQAGECLPMKAKPWAQTPSTAKKRKKKKRESISLQLYSPKESSWLI